MFKSKIIEIVKILGNVNEKEIFVIIQLSFGQIDSIELDNGDIYLHKFCEDNIDIQMDLDDITQEDQEIIYSELCKLAYN